MRLWELGYNSFRQDQALQVLSQRLIGTALNSRSETMKSTVYIAEKWSAMLQASTEIARNTLEDDFEFQPGRDRGNKRDKSERKTSIFIGFDFLLHQELAIKLECQFYYNICDATTATYLSMAMSLSKMVKGGTPQFWRLVSRELVKAKNEGLLDEADLKKLVEMRLGSRSQKFFLTAECMEAVGMENTVEELENQMRDSYQEKYRKH